MRHRNMVGPAPNDWVGALSGAHGVTCATESLVYVVHLYPCAIEIWWGPAPNDWVGALSVAHGTRCATEMLVSVATHAP